MIGLGNVGRGFLRILETKGERLADQYGLAFRVVCVADSSGVAVNPQGIRPGCDPAAQGRRRARGELCPGTGPGRRRHRCWRIWPWGWCSKPRRSICKTGEPGLSVTRTSLAARHSGGAGQQGAAGAGVCRAAGPGAGARRRPWLQRHRVRCAAGDQHRAARPRSGRHHHAGRHLQCHHELHLGRDGHRALICRRPGRGPAARHCRNRPVAGRGRVGHGQQAGDHRQQLPRYLGHTGRCGRSRASRR